MHNKRNKESKLLSWFKKYNLVITFILNPIYFTINKIDESSNSKQISTTRQTISNTTINNYYIYTDRNKPTTLLQDTVKTKKE